MTQIVLVTGATGNVGRNVVDQLHERGVTVRALTRDPDRAAFPSGVEVVRGDLTQPGSLPAALEGVSAAFLFPVRAGAHAFAVAAKRAGVEHVVVLSSMGVTDAEVQNNPIGAMHREVELAVAESGLAWTFLRPGSFATNALGWAHEIKATGRVRAPYPDAVSASIHEADIAAVGVTALTEPGHRGRSYRLTGPEPDTRAAQVRLIGEALGTEIPFEEVSADEWRAAVAAHMPPGFAEQLLAYWRDSAEHPPAILPTVEEVTGRPARRFRQWALDHRDDFRQTI